MSHCDSCNAAFLTSGILSHQKTKLHLSKLTDQQKEEIETKIKEKAATEVECKACNVTFTKHSLLRHNRSLKHLANIANEDNEE